MFKQATFPLSNISQTSARFSDQMGFYGLEKIKTIVHCYTNKCETVKTLLLLVLIEVLALIESSCKNGPHPTTTFILYIILFLMKYIFVEAKAECRFSYINFFIAILDT